MKIKGIWRMKKKIKTKTDEINILIEKYKNKEAKLIDIKYDRKEFPKEKIIKILSYKNL
ncbi:hypothetical protein H8356DRAFT_1331763 [Neocallimastix lanati (nom. inval.)]|nr:hypothetical protein H8356DRAFT_1331763 [Neocallimastix sp. JGI-2020a]